MIFNPLGRSHPNPYISAQGALFGNRPGSVKTMPMVTLYAKFEVSTKIRLGCRGGALWSERMTNWDKNHIIIFSLRNVIIEI